MKWYSTKNPKHQVSFREALFQGLAPDKGLYMPSAFYPFKSSFINSLKEYSFQEIALRITERFLQDEIPEKHFIDIIHKSITFPAPLVQLTDNQFILELWHGPSLAFKDFGARFMAQMMQYFLLGSNHKLYVLVATSGDTGGAVAAGFDGADGIEVIILYPKNRVSELQRKQLTTLGNNIHAIEIDGSFDDCQSLVKTAFLDHELKKTHQLSSANSINIARLIPQTFYYFEAYKQLSTQESVVFSVPSGNFGNLCAGVFAFKLGLPIAHFIAATNLNDVFPEYLRTAEFNPRSSIQTLSNAMDVGNPSNFYRILDVLGSTWNNVSKHISGRFYNDEETVAAIQEVFYKYQYEIDPHGAIAYLAMKNYITENDPPSPVIALETAHPAKFIATMQKALQKDISIPMRLSALINKKETFVKLDNNYNQLKDFLFIL